MRQVLSNAPDDEMRSWYKNEYEKIASDRLMGKVMHATSSIVSNPFVIPQVADYALIHLENNRIGRNTLRIPENVAVPSNYTWK